MLSFSLMLSVLAPLAPGSDPLVLSEEQALKASDSNYNRRFGTSVAMTQDLLVVGDPRASGNAPTSGAVYVFVRAGDRWVEEAKLFASDGATSDLFGQSVAVSGETIVVGARWHAVGGVGTGAAYVFVRQAGSWQQQAQLVTNDATLGDRLGEAVAIDGDLIVITADYHDDLGPNSGAAYLFRRTGAHWSQEAELLPSDGEPYDFFGISAAIHDGTVVVGASEEDQGADSAGAVYVFVPQGPSWVEEVKLIASDPTYGANFGTSVSLRGDTLLVGAEFANGGAIESGAVYAFRRQGGAWSQTAKLYSEQSLSNDRFGLSVALGDGVALIGARASDTPVTEAGSAHLFGRCGDRWQETARLTYTNPHDFDQLGTSVALQGPVAVAGAPQADIGGTLFTYSIGASAAPSYCAGDGSARSCPCGNESTPGSMQGCLNSTGAGAVLIAAGSTSVSTDALQFHSCQLPPNQTALLFAGANAIAQGDGILFGDGLRCAGGSVVRLGVCTASPDGAATWGPGLVDIGNWSPGEVRRFQAWYRDPLGSPCGSHFNTTPGIELRFSY